MEPEYTVDSDKADGDQQQPPSIQRDWPLPIILTSAINSIQLQKQLKGLVKGSFEFRNTRNRTRIANKEIAWLRTSYFSLRTRSFLDEQDRS
jgi:hypothetical protein